MARRHLIFDQGEDFGDKPTDITHIVGLGLKTPAGGATSNGNDPIAAALKQMHDAVAGEALPDDFLRLLDEIDTKIAANKVSN
jgi:hypothetical protein